MILLLALFGSVSASAKTLTVNCQSSAGKSLKMISEIANVNTPQVIKFFSIDGGQISNLRDVSKMPIYRNGDISLEVQYGNSLYSSAEMSLTKCTDDFEATGKAVVKEYVGGFAGTRPYDLNCTCTFK